MMTFELAPPNLVRVCEEADAGWGALVARFAVLRDHQGKLHLLLCTKASKQLSPPAVRALEAKLTEELGAYFVPPILFTEDENRDRSRLAKNMGSRCDTLFQRWPEAPSSGPDRWFKREQRLSKLDWLESSVSPPWRARAQTPFIVSFYSFKGGVGRTTALLSCAYQLAKSGVPVAVVDLDLEAPGLGGVLGAQAQRGVLDFLVEYMVHKRPDSLDDYVDNARVLGDVLAPLVAVYPAGDLQQGFLEKLARLDYLGQPGEGDDAVSPVGQALQALLKAIKERAVGPFPRPEFIFIDSRAGLHDLAGLALHGLAHLDVLCARATRQSLDGLTLTVSTLGKRRKDALPACTLVHTMASDSPAAQAEETRDFTASSYEAFKEHIYKPQLERDASYQIPPLGSGVKGPLHVPEVLPYKSELARFDSLTPEVCNALNAPSYQELLVRIREKRPTQ